MCGIGAIVALERDGYKAGIRDKKETAARLNRGLEQIKHRGPDSQGQWISHDGRVGPLPFQPHQTNMIFPSCP